MFLIAHYTSTAGRLISRLIRMMRQTMTKIKVRHGESLEQALRRFNKEVQKAGILQEVRDRERYRKPSEIRRQKAKELANRLYIESKRK